MKQEIELADELLRAYESYVRDRIKQGHCLSAEWRYKPEESNNPNQEPIIKKYPVEVMELVGGTLASLAKTKRVEHNIIKIHYRGLNTFSRVTVCRPALRKHQRLNHEERLKQVDRALWFFFVELKKQIKLHKLENIKELLDL